MEASTRNLALSAVVMLGVLQGCGQPDSAAQMRSAKEALAKNDSRAAIIELKAALQQSAESAEARFLLGKALLDTGDAASAEIELRKALTLGYPEAAVMPPLARSLLARAQGSKVVAQFAEVKLSDTAADADIQTSLALAYLQLGGHAREAEAALAAVFQLAPDYAPGLLAKARIKAAAHDVDGALAAVDQVLNKNGKDAAALQFKGDLLYFAKHDPDGAVKALRQALAVRSDLIPAHNSLMTVLLSQKDMTAAKAQLEVFKKAAPKYLLPTYFEAEMAFINKDYKTARESIQLVLRSAPDDFRSLHLAGAIELAAGANAEAEGLLGKALKLAPDSAATRTLLAQSALRTGRPERVLEVLQPVLELPQPEAEPLALAAQAYLQTGQVAKAEELFTRIGKLDPDSVVERTLVAARLVSKGNLDAGFAQLEAIAKSDKGTVADLALINGLVRHERLDAALKALDNLERKAPQSPLAPGTRGWLLLARKDVPGGRKSFERALEIDPLYFMAANSLAAQDLRENKPDAARGRFEAMLKVDPKNVRALLALAELRGMTGGTPDEVAKLLSEAMRLNPVEVDPRLRLIDLWLQASQFDKALAVARDSVAARPNSPQLLDALGRAQLASGDSNQAVGTFTKLGEMQPKSPMPSLRLAEIYLAQSNLDAARNAYRRAIALSSEPLQAQRSLIALEIAAGRPKDALVVAKAVRDAPATEATGWMLIGDVEASRKSWVDAESAYRAASQKAPGSGELAGRLHTVLEATGRSAEAARFVSTWISQHPKDLLFRGYLADAALAKGDYAGAETAYLALLKLQPDHAEALNKLAVATMKLKKPGALTYADRAVQLRPDDPFMMDTLAFALREEKQLPKAIEVELKAVAMRPQEPAYRLHLAKLYIEARQKDKAKTELERLAKQGDKFGGQAEVSRLLETL